MKANIKLFLFPKIKAKDLLVKSFLNIYAKDLALRDSCYNCKFTSKNRVSDITLADFWGIDEINKDFNDGKGVSLVIINTKKGNNLFEKSKKYFDYFEYDLFKYSQPRLEKPTKEPQNNTDLWKDYNKKGYKYVAKKYGGYSFIKNQLIKIKYLLKNKLEK